MIYKSRMKKNFISITQNEEAFEPKALNVISDVDICSVQASSQQRQFNYDSLEWVSEGNPEWAFSRDLFDRTNFFNYNKLLIAIDFNLFNLYVMFIELT